MPVEERLARRLVARGEERVRGDHPREPIGVLADETQADEPAPVLADERHVAKVELIEERAPHPLDVPRVGVVGACRGLVGATEADQIGRDATQSGVDEHRDHLAVEETPRRFAVEQQHDVCVARSLVEIVDPERGPSLEGVAPSAGTST